MPSAMKFTFDSTPTGSNMTIFTTLSSVEAMEQANSGMEEGLRAAMSQLDAVLAETERVRCGRFELSQSPQNAVLQMRRLQIIEHISLDGVIERAATTRAISRSQLSAPFRTPPRVGTQCSPRMAKASIYCSAVAPTMAASQALAKAPSSPMADRLDAATKIHRYPPSGKS